jgi:hypothetical protein
MPEKFPSSVPDNPAEESQRPEQSSEALVEQKESRLVEVRHDNLVKFDGSIPVGEHWIVNNLYKSKIKVPKGAKLTVEISYKSETLNEGGEIEVKGIDYKSGEHAQESKELQKGPKEIQFEEKAKPATPERSAKICSQCGRRGNSEWTICPYCTFEYGGQSVEKFQVLTCPQCGRNRGSEFVFCPYCQYEF